MRRALIGLVLCASGAVPGCGGPPTSVDEGDAPFDWRVAVAELDEALLAGCGQDEAIHVVGGAGEAGLILEWTGVEWFAPDLPPETGVLWWCWVDETGTVWAVGERATVLRKRAGDEWIREDLRGAVDARSTLFGVWGAGPEDVWAVGGSPGNAAPATAIAHFDGQRWQPVDTEELPAQPLFKVWGAGAEDVWAVGAQGTALHHDGAGWEVVATPTEDRLISVWGTGPGDVYAVGGLGTGVVLRHDGSAWSLFANAPEELAAVWTAPGQPLYVGGNRGFVARYALDETGRADPARVTSRVTVDDACVHALHGGESTLVATAADLVGGGGSGWRGAVLVHGEAALDGPVTRAPGPDAGVDASVDASMDAGVDAGMDAGMDASAGPGPGEPCGQVPDVCGPGLECWLLLESGVFLCTQPCADASACTAYGPDPCCVLPGPQTLVTVCAPGEYTECAPP